MTAAQAFVINPRIQPPRARSLPFVDMAAVDGSAQYVEASQTRGLGGGSRFEDGDTLMARITPCLENGKIARFRSTDRHGFGFGSTEFIVFRGRDGVTTSDFAFYTVKSEIFRDFAISQMSGTSGRQRVPTTCFEHLHLSIPPIATQTKITGVLSALDGKIENNQRASASLEAMARALFKSWFVDFDPVQAKAEGLDTGLPADIAALFPTSFDDEGLPDGWRSGSLDDLADTNSESWKASSHPEEVEYVDLSNCKWGNIDGTTQYKWEHAPSRARRVARAGDTILGTVRPGNGSYALVGREGLTVSTGFAVLRPKEVIYREMVYFAATSIDNIRWLEQLAAGHGGAYPAVNPDKVSATAVTVPCEKVAQAFASTTADMIDRIELLKQESNDLEQLRDTLLPKLLSGELRVTDAEAEIAAA